MRHVAIACDDALKIIDQFDSPQTLFYVDPPYLGTDQGHYKWYSKDNYLSLINKLSNIQGSSLLSTYPQTNDNYPDNWELHTFKTSSTIAGTNEKVSLKGSERIECVYYKPRSGTLGIAEQKVYDSGVLDCFIGGDIDPNYVAIALDRVARLEIDYQPSSENGFMQLNMFARDGD
jgi:hypothetical protein